MQCPISEAQQSKIVLGNSRPFIGRFGLRPIGLRLLSSALPIDRAWAPAGVSGSPECTVEPPERIHRSSPGLVSEAVFARLWNGKFLGTPGARWGYIRMASCRWGRDE